MESGKKNPFEALTPEEKQANEAQKKLTEESVLEARKAAQACRDSDLFKDYEAKYRVASQYFFEQMLDLDASKVGVGCELAKIQGQVDMLRSLSKVVRIDAGAN